MSTLIPDASSTRIAGLKWQRTRRANLRGTRDSRRLACFRRRLPDFRTRPQLGASMPKRQRLHDSTESHPPALPVPFSRNPSEPGASATGVNRRRTPAALTLDGWHAPRYFEGRADAPGMCPVATSSTQEYPNVHENHQSPYRKELPREAPTALQQARPATRADLFLLSSP
jgi:hypothetical protein